MRHQLKHRWMRAKKHTHTNSEKQRLGLPDRGESKTVSAAARKAIAGIKCLALPSYIVAASNGKKKTKTTKWASAKDSSAQQHHPAVYSLKKARDSQSHTHKPKYSKDSQRGIRCEQQQNKTRFTFSHFKSCVLLLNASIDGSYSLQYFLIQWSLLNAHFIDIAKGALLARPSVFFHLFINTAETSYKDISIKKCDK